MLLAENPEAITALKHLKEALNPNGVDKDLAAKIEEALNKVDPEQLAEDIKGGSTPEVLKELIHKNNGDLEKALDNAGKAVKNKPAFNNLKKLRSALGLKPSALPESKDLAEGSLKDAKIEKL